jgi:hypothetical protein
MKAKKLRSIFASINDGILEQSVSEVDAEGGSTGDLELFENKSSSEERATDISLSGRDSEIAIEERIKRKLLDNLMNSWLPFIMDYYLKRSQIHRIRVFEPAWDGKEEEESSFDPYMNIIPFLQHNIQSANLAYNLKQEKELKLLTNKLLYLPWNPVWSVEFVKSNRRTHGKYSLESFYVLGSDIKRFISFGFQQSYCVQQMRYFVKM